MTSYADIALQGRISNFAKYLMVVIAVAIIISTGVLIAYVVKQDKEFKRNNFGVYDITLSDSGTTVSNDGRASVEYKNLKIGQKESFKFGFKLSKSTKSNGTIQIQQEGKTITKEVPNGVYIKFVITGEVYDVDENGARIINQDYCQKLNNVISSSCYAISSWDKKKNEFYFCASKNEDDHLRVGEKEEYFSNGEIVMYFNSAAVDGSWWDKIVVLNLQLVTIDYLSPNANNW